MPKFRVRCSSQALVQVVIFFCLTESPLFIEHLVKGAAEKTLKILYSTYVRDSLSPSGDSTLEAILYSTDVRDSLSPSGDSTLEGTYYYEKSFRITDC